MALLDQLNAKYEAAVTKADDEVKQLLAATRANIESSLDSAAAAGERFARVQIEAPDFDTAFGLTARVKDHYSNLGFTVEVGPINDMGTYHFAKIRFSGWASDTPPEPQIVR